MTERTTHINLDGNKGVCSSPYNCPFSDPDQHYADEQEAQKAFEELMDAHNEVFGEYPREKISMKEMRHKVRDQQKALEESAAAAVEQLELDSLKYQANRKIVENDLSRFTVLSVRDLFGTTRSRWEKQIRENGILILTEMGIDQGLSNKSLNAIRGKNCSPTYYSDKEEFARQKVAQTNMETILNHHALPSKYSSLALVARKQREGYYTSMVEYVAKENLLNVDANVGHLVAIATNAPVSDETWETLEKRFLKLHTMKDTVIVAAAHPDPLIRSQAVDTLSTVFPESLNKDDVFTLTEAISYLPQRDQASIASQIEFHVERSFNPMEVEEFHSMKQRWYPQELLAAEKLQGRKPKKSFMTKMLGR